jgi:hypothetical protein
MLLTDRLIFFRPAAILSGLRPWGRTSGGRGARNWGRSAPWSYRSATTGLFVWNTERFDTIKGRTASSELGW